jgi:hypothetical protein
VEHSMNRRRQGLAATTRCSKPSSSPAPRSARSRRSVATACSRTGSSARRLGGGWSPRDGRGRARAPTRTA